MSVRDYAGLALIVVGSVFALGLAFGFLMGMRHELARGRREGAEDPSRARRGDAPGRDDGRKNSAGVYRSWRQL